MASSGIAGQLARLVDSPPQERADGYKQALQSIISSRNPGNLVAYVQSIISDSIGVINSRPLLSDFIHPFKDIASNDVKIEAGSQILQVLAPKIVSYEQQDTDLKLILADAYEAEEDFNSSARTLQNIQLDSSQRTVSDDDRAKIWMRVCRCYLEEEDPTSALTFLNRIKNVIHSVKDQATRLQFQLSQARISDSQRNFLDASASYLALSNEAVIDEEERLQALSAAITCAILAPAGPLRAKQLGRLYKDERAVETPEYEILKKIFLDRMLSPSEVSTFASGLKEHQLAKTSDGSTVLDKAILEHNLVAVSRIYTNISFQRLAQLLEVDADRAEVYAAGMVESGRLSGSIDQIESIIHFNQMSSGLGSNNVMADLRAWDVNVQQMAEELERVTTMLQREQPQSNAVES